MAHAHTHTTGQGTGVCGTIAWLVTALTSYVATLTPKKKKPTPKQQEPTDTHTHTHNLQSKEPGFAGASSAWRTTWPPVATLTLKHQLKPHTHTHTMCKPRNRGLRCHRAVAGRLCLRWPHSQKEHILPTPTTTHTHTQHTHTTCKMVQVKEQVSAEASSGRELTAAREGASARSHAPWHQS